MRLACGSDVIMLKKLYKEIFPDCTDRYIERVFSSKVCLDNTIVEEVNGVIVGTVYFWDYGLYVDGVYYKAAYVNAVGTMLEYRGKGVMRAMMSYCDALLNERGYDYAVLIPADAYLYDVYAKMDYSEVFIKQRGIISEEIAGNQLSVSELTTDSYAYAVDNFTGATHIVHDKIDAKLIIDDAKDYGSQTLQLHSAQGDLMATCFAKISINQANVYELLMRDAENINDIIFTLQKHFGVINMNINMPVYDSELQKMPCGMVKRLKDNCPKISQPAYMNMMLN